MAEDAVDQGTSGDEPVREWGVDDDGSGSRPADGRQTDDSPTDGRPTPESDDGERRGDDGDTYGGLPGAFAYVFRSSDSWLLRSYAVLGGLAALLTAILFGLALVVLLGNTVGVGGGTFSFVRAFFIFVGLLVVAPLVAPVLFAARRTRHGRSDRRFDAAMAALGYLFVGSLYVAAVISTPVAQQQLPAGGLARAVVQALYSLPRLAGLVPPVLVALSIVVVARRFR
jgi:hypothetical protein